MSKTIYSKDQKRIVERLRKARLDAGLNQKGVAKLIGKTQSFVSKIESGQRRIDVLKLKAFAKIYNKQTNYFLK